MSKIVNQEEIEKAIAENPNLDAKTRFLMMNFSDKFVNYLLAKKYFRWKKDFPTYIKGVKIEKFDDEDRKKYNKTTLGYYDRSRKLIRLREISLKLADISHILTHEFYHYISYSPFSVFLNEGLTEYLAKMTEDDAGIAYCVNTGFAWFLHEMMGDSLIKAYFLGSTKEFNENFAYLLGGEKAKKEGENSPFVIEAFNSVVDKIHSEVYGDAKTKRYDAHNYPQFMTYIKNIVVNSVSLKAQDLYFYRTLNDGTIELDSNKIDDEFRRIESLLRSEDFSFYGPFDGYTHDEINIMIAEMKKQALQKIIEHSHFMVTQQKFSAEQLADILSYGGTFYSSPRIDSDALNALNNRYGKNVSQALLHVYIQNKNYDAIMGFDVSQMIMDVIRATTTIYPSARDFEYEQVANLFLSEHTPEFADPNRITSFVVNNKDLLYFITAQNNRVKRDAADTAYFIQKDGSILQVYDGDYYLISENKNHIHKRESLSKEEAETFDQEKEHALYGEKKLVRYMMEEYFYKMSKGIQTPKRPPRSLKDYMAERKKPDNKMDLKSTMQKLIKEFSSKHSHVPLVSEIGKALKYIKDYGKSHEH